jgi:hypothetical protein
MLKRTRSLPFFAAALAFGVVGCKVHEREQAGHFEIRSVREDFAGHSRTRMSLVYHGRTLAEGLSDWTVDPRSAERIVYASTAPCGTFFFDGATTRSLALASQPVIVHAAADDSPEFAGSTPWSPDGRHLWIGNDIANPVVADLEAGSQIDLTNALSAGRRRLSMTAVMWSPDGDQVAVIVQPEGYNHPDRDLVAIALSPLRAAYVATMTDNVGHGLLLWTTADFQWKGGRLVSASGGQHGSVTIKSPDQVGWTSTPPNAPSVGLVGASCQ